MRQRNQNIWNINTRALKYPSLQFSLHLVCTHLLHLGGVTAAECQVAHPNDCKIIYWKWGNPFTGDVNESKMHSAVGWDIIFTLVGNITFDQVIIHYLRFFCMHWVLHKVDVDMFVRTDPWSVAMLMRQRIPDPERSPWCWTQHGPAKPVFKNPLDFQQPFPAEIAAPAEVGAPADTSVALALFGISCRSRYSDSWD